MNDELLELTVERDIAEMPLDGYMRYEPMPSGTVTIAYRNDAGLRTTLRFRYEGQVERAEQYDCIKTPDESRWAAEAESLRRWKAEALPLLELLDRCHDLLPEAARARLAHSKAEAVERFLADRP